MSVNDRHSCDGIGIMFSFPSTLTTKVKLIWIRTDLRTTEVSSPAATAS